MSFRRAAEITLAYEGEDSDHTADPGGRTRFGIAQRWHPGIDVAKLTREQAVDLLEIHYWTPIRGDQLPWPLAAAVFDHAVHGGPASAAKALQRAVGAKPDGRIGPLTLAAVATAPQRALIADVLRRRARELAAEGNPAFLAGWMARITDLALALGAALPR